jgi:hypothetical protein
LDLPSLRVGSRTGRTVRVIGTGLKSEAWA